MTSTNEYRYTMLTQQELQKARESFSIALETIRYLDYMAPDSWKDVLADKDTAETVLIIAGALSHAHNTYAKKGVTHE